MPTTAHAQEQGWRTTAAEDGIRMEARQVAGERFDELRVSTTLQASPEAIADYLFGKYLDQKNKNISRTFIKRSPTLTIWSDVGRSHHERPQGGRWRIRLAPASRHWRLNTEKAPFEKGGRPARSAGRGICF